MRWQPNIMRALLLQKKDNGSDAIIFIFFLGKTQHGCLYVYNGDSTTAICCTVCYWHWHPFINVAQNWLLYATKYNPQQLECTLYYMYFYIIKYLSLVQKTPGWCNVWALLQQIYIYHLSEVVDTVCLSIDAIFPLTFIGLNKHKRHVIKVVYIALKMKPIPIFWVNCSSFPEKHY